MGNALNCYKGFSEGNINIEKEALEINLDKEELGKLGNELYDERAENIEQIFNVGDIIRVLYSKTVIRELISKDWSDQHPVLESNETENAKKKRRKRKKGKKRDENYLEIANVENNEVELNHRRKSSECSKEKLNKDELNEVQEPQNEIFETEKLKNRKKKKTKNTKEIKNEPSINNESFEGSKNEIASSIRSFPIIKQQKCCIQTKLGDLIIEDFQSVPFNGEGKFVFPDKSEYDGEWLNNRMHGQGIFTWPDGRKYIGEFKNGQKDGFGKMSWKNGRVYEGYWKEGKQHGEGMLKLKGVKSFYNIEGLWENGIRVKTVQTTY